MSIEIHSEALGRRTQIDRVIGVYGAGDGPTVVVIAGIHGNEPAGVFALLDVLDQLRRETPRFRGKLIGLAGNLAALSRGVRYVDADLNRLWRREWIDAAFADETHANSAKAGAELRELRELYQRIKAILSDEAGPIHFIDLHTTSSQSPPFIPFDDTLVNRRFVESFPVPGILGIEEYLPGTLLSYMTRYQTVAIGYEGGQHSEHRSIDYHRAMLWLSLEKAGCVSRTDVPRLAEQEALLQRGANGLGGFYEVRFRYEIQPGEDFRMLPGFRSFQPVTRAQQLAENNSGAIPAPETGRIFMPLYQAQGSDGFFLIRRVAGIWLKLSKWLRHWRFERVLALLPGVELARDDAGTLTVDTRIARFLALELFHLLGYRRQVRDGARIHFSRREP
jgi:hypothetical protein